MKKKKFKLDGEKQSMNQENLYLMEKEVKQKMKGYLN